MQGKNSVKLSEHEYYGPLINSHTKSILKSGLLLDEDLEALLNVSDFGNVPPKIGYKLSFSLLGNIVSVLSCSFIAKKYHLSPFLAVPSAIIAAKFIVTELQNYRMRKSDKEIVQKLIEVLGRIHKLNRSIIRYMKTRTDLGNTQNSFFTTYSKSINDFVEFTLKNEYNFFKYTENIIKTISLYSSELSDDFTCLMCLNPFAMLETTNGNNIENCVVLTQQIQDLHILFTSKFLSYIGIVCCSKTSSLLDHDLDVLLNKTLCNSLKYFEQYHDLVRRQFVTLRQSVLRKCEYTLQAKVKTTGSKQVQTKLKETLVSSVNNMSIILEKSQNVLDVIENVDNVNLNEVSNAIIDLKNHTFATYESLDLLCKLYGILANSNATNRAGNKITTLMKDNDPEDKLAVINYDDTAEPLEERFELYIGNEDLVNENSSTSHEYDRSNEYLSLMLKELRQSLRQHQRFIEAKNRRGSDDEDKIKRSTVELRKSPPKFNLSVVNAEPNQINVPPVLSGLTEQNEIASVNVPPPPPLPLPAFNLDKLEEDSGHVNARSMLDNIKALSSQRNVQEEVFGDPDVDSCSDYDS